MSRRLSRQEWAILLTHPRLAFHLWREWRRLKRMRERGKWPVSG